MRSIRGPLLVALALATLGGDAAAQGEAEEAAARAETAVPDDLAAAASPAAPDPSAAEPATTAAPNTPIGGAPPGSEIERAWFTPAASLEERVARTRRASLQYGVWSLDAAARALLSRSSEGGPLERARSAARLAPDLPLARIELARAIWLHDDAPVSALRAAWAAVLGIPRHPEAAIWFAGAGLVLLAMTLVGGGLLTMALAGVLVAPRAAHDLADLLSCATPSFARGALLGALLLVPLAFGEGIAGVALVLMAVACTYGRRRERMALALAAAAVVAGAYPVARLAGSTVTLFERDLVAEAAYASAHGSALQSGALRLAAAADSDPLAELALAQLARRTRSLAAADAHYQALLETRPNDWRIANNAANVRLELGHMEAALALYQGAAEQTDSAVVFYNLAQAYGRAFQVEELAATLEYAQSLDRGLLAELAQLQGRDPEGFVIDLPLPTRLLWERLAGTAAGEALAAELRAPFAPGRLGQSAAVACVAFAAALLAGSLLGGAFRPSRGCTRCGGWQCSRCDPETGGSAVCSACTRLFFQPEDTDRVLRLERINALRDRERRIEKLVAAASLAVPGAAGFLARSPLRSLIGCLLFVFALVAVVHRAGPLPDPWVAGDTAPFLFLHAAALAGLAYALVVGTAMAARRRL